MKNLSPENVFLLRDRSTEELLKVTDELYDNHNAELAYGIAKVRLVRLQFLLHSVLTDLPTNKDWLDPHLEDEIKRMDSNG